ncbi:RHS repeat-associated core domain-containing protein [Morganella morganii]|uniref:RHS repeat-associated core domain-containing protein n=1 Tax=Morganella morganii TaxID=582 RepID=UPI0034E20629
MESFDHPEKQTTDIAYYHVALNGLPEELTDSQGRIIWHGDYSLWGKLRRETRPVPGFRGQQNLRFQGQYFDRETGLHYNTFRYYAPDTGRFTQQDPIGLLGGLNLYQYAPNPLTWVDPWGWACIPNKVAGTAREKRAQEILEKRYGKENVLSERYLRGADGKSVKDPLTGERRRVDFVVKGRDGKWRPVEITSLTAPKGPQIEKEIRIRNDGGIFVKNKNTGKLVEIEGISTVIRAR